MEYAWFNNVETKPGIGYPKTGRTGISGKAAGSAALAADAPPRQSGQRIIEDFRQPGAAGDRRLLRTLYL